MTLGELLMPYFSQEIFICLAGWWCSPPEQLRRWTSFTHHLCSRAPAWALAPSMCLHFQQLVIQMIRTRTCFSFVELASWGTAVGIGCTGSQNRGDVLKVAELSLCHYCSGFSGSAWSILTLTKLSFGKLNVECLVLKWELVTVLQGRASLCHRFSGWPRIRHHTPPCFPCLWGVLLPTHLLRGKNNN